jgi:hypothetical protein
MALDLCSSPGYIAAMYETQRESRARKLEEGWKRVEAYLDPDTAKRWAKLVRMKAHKGPTALLKAALDSLEERSSK